MIRVGELFGHPIYTDPDIPRGELRMIGTAPGFDVVLEDGVIVVRRRTATVKIVGIKEGDEGDE